MRTSADFQSNPIGTFFDPEKVWQAHKAGEAFAALRPAIRAGKFKPDAIPPWACPSRPGGAWRFAERRLSVLFGE